MRGEMHIGDNIHQSGPASIGKIQYQGGLDPQAALREMINLAMDLGAQVGAEHREAINESIQVIRQGENAGRGALRRAVANLIGIAAMAGAVGGPVLDAALKVKELFGL
jgi:hypothetical protein